MASYPKRISLNILIDLLQLAFQNTRMTGQAVQEPITISDAAHESQHDALCAGQHMA